jgi:hypothetical protein
MLDALCINSLGLFFVSGSACFYSLGSKRIKKGFFVSDGIWENKNPFFIGLSAGKNKDFERGQKNSMARVSKDGRAQTNLRSKPLSLNWMKLIDGCF